MHGEEHECDCGCGDGECDCEGHDDNGHKGDCCHRIARFRGVIHIAILSLLKNKETHGSDLGQMLKDRFGMEVAKPVVYMSLRRMERHGFLASHWDMEGSGPAKRLYRITEDGADYLTESITELKKMAETIGQIAEESGK